MATVLVELPNSILLMLKRKAESEGKSLEELINEAIINYYGISDPEAKVQMHKGLCEKYLREGDGFLMKKDYVKASEKFWGAASQIVKALAAKKGLELRSHSDLHREVVKIVREKGDVEMRLLWQSAIVLHQNFYENWLPSEIVEEDAKDVKKLVDKVKDLLA